MSPRRGLLACAVGAIFGLAPAVAEAAWPTLEDSVARARANALVVLEARGQVGVAQASMAGARASIFGNPYAEVQVQHGRTDTGDFPAQINGFVFLPFDVHGQRGARMDEADKLTEWRRLGLLDAQARAVGETIAVYGQVLVESERVAEAARAEEDAKREVEFFGQRMAAGDATVFEKSLAEAESGRWAQTRAEAKVRLIEARAAIAQLTGTPGVDEPPPDAAPMPPPLRHPYGPQSSAELVERSPLLREVRAEAKYWDASGERHAAERNAPLNVIVNGGYGQVGEPRVGGGLSWTLPVTRRNQGEIARAGAEHDRAVAFHATARAVIETRVRAAFETLEVTRAAVAEQDRAGIPATARVVDAALSMYRAGKGELLRVFIARRDLATARARRLELLSMAWRAYGALAALKGELP